MKRFWKEVGTVESDGGWRVTLDKKTFVAYRQVRQPGLAELLPAHIKRIRSCKSRFSASNISLSPTTFL